MCLNGQDVLGPTVDTAFLRRTAIFAALPDQALRMIQASGETRTLGAGRVVFDEGAPGLDLYVVKSGVLEVLKGEHVVSYLSAGECVGEMSFLTGAPRSATVRVMERAEVLRIPGLVFERILKQNAEVAFALARVLAHRLELTSQLKASEGAGSGRHLSGDLRFFDLGEICQTLMQSRRTGVLRLQGPKLSGDHAMWFYQGVVRHARFGPLQDTEAALALLRHRVDASFVFEGSDAYTGPERAGDLLDGSMGLLLEAARHEDEIGELRGLVPEILVRKADDFPWLGPPSRPSQLAPGEDPVASGHWQPATESERLIALELWDAIGDESPLEPILGRFFGRELLALKIVRALQRLGAIG